MRARDLKGGAKARFIAKKVAKWTLIVGLLGALGLAIAIFVAYRLVTIPSPNKAFQAQTTTIYYADGRHVIGTFAVQNRHSVPLAAVPTTTQDAVIAAENRTFYSDSGLDPRGIIRAAWHDLTSSGSTQGASTITQQYVKILYLNQQRTLSRKLHEAFLAVKIDRTLSKDQILQGYLNTIYFGRGAYGIDAAAQAYFDEPVEQLTARQGAVLASVLNSPGTLDPAVSRSNRARLLARYRYVLDGMAAMGDLTQQRAQALGQVLPKLAKPAVRNVNGGQRGFLLTLVRERLRSLGYSDEEIDAGGLKVTTTFSWKDMRAAVAATRKNRPPKHPTLNIGLASIDPSTGALRAMIGGRNFLHSQNNWATNRVQPGSSFKPYALAAGLENGFTLQSVLDGKSPYVLPDGTEIHNDVAYGPARVSLLTATEQSINSAYVDLVQRIPGNGPQKVLDVAAALGIPTNNMQPVPVVPLGVFGVSPVNQANGYATFADGGQHHPWYVISQIRDSSGLRYSHQVKTTQALRPAVASNVTYALQKVVTNGTGRNALALGRPAAGKTGTATATGKDGTEHVSAAWFVGYTPQLATAVAFTRGTGYQPLDGGYLVPYFGANYPCATWTDYMRAALAGEPVERFPAPAGLRPSSPPTTTAPTTTAPTTRPPTTAPTTTAPTTSAPTSTSPTASTSPPTSTSSPPTTTSPTSSSPTSPSPTAKSPGSPGPSRAGPAP
ncbi:MAG TPA: transglycosylase domain-containing protein [Nocardioidaceae bacterium]|nr:transglycosylase domain-containing protein [Nocardioidaceae bacterium]